MVIKEGYKQTEIGVIPIDWEVRTFDELTDKIIGGGTPSRSNSSFWGNEIPWVTVKDFATFNPFTTQEYITKIGLQNSASHLIPKGIIITSTRMALGKAVIYDIDVSINQDLKAIYPKNIIDTNFFYYWFQFNAKKIEELGSGCTVMGLSLPDLRKIKLKIPTHKEQNAIATALSDADGLITGLEKLIAKKRNIKQGAMQQLLQPKDGWEVKKLGEVSDLITKGTTPTSVGREFQNKGINFIKIESLQKNGEIVKDKVAFIDEFTHNLLKRSQLKSKDILFSIAGALGRVAIVKDEILPANTNQALAIIRLKDGYLVDYIYFYLNNEKIQKYILTISVQGAQANLSLLNISELDIPFPTLEEQTRIATILSDMDAELSALEQKLEKYKKVKLGMMQELLTGKTRLN